MRSTIYSLLLGSAVCALALTPAAGLAQAPATSAMAAPSKVRVLTEQDMLDLAVGTGIQATRATNTEGMIRQIKEALARGQTFKIIEPADLKPEGMVAVPGAVGGGGAWEFVLEDVKKAGLKPIDNPIQRAMQELMKDSDKPIQAVIRAESAEATMTAFMVASALDLPLVDACLSARARPETQQSIPETLHIKRADRMVGVSRWGDSVTFNTISDPVRGEHLMRALAVASGGGISLAGEGYTAAEVQRGTIHGSITQAILWGRTVREAREKGKDPIDALTRVSKGFRMFQGKVAKAEMKGEKGFTYWDVELAGTGGFTGHSYKIHVKNENIVTWLDGKPDAMSPDFISNLDPATGLAMASGQGLGAYQIGKEIAMVGIPSSPMWRVARGIELMGPRHFGFDFDYVPVEEQMKRRPKL
jgi:DUF917 family protein